MKRFLTILLMIGGIGAGAWAAYDRYVTPVQAQSDQPAYETIVVNRGAIASTVSATGSI